MSEAKPPAPSGGGKKKRNRKRGGGGGAKAGGGDTLKDAPAAAALASAPITTTAGRGGGNKKRRGGGGGGRGGGGGGESSSNNRFNKNASSPIQLPHVKVTIRNIGDPNKHGTMEGIVNSVRTFLEGAFPSSSTNNTPSTAASVEGQTGYDPYTLAWQLEKEEFDSAKNMFAEAAAAAADGTASSSASSSTSTATRAFSSGWVYEEKCQPNGNNGMVAPLFADRFTMDATIENLVTKLLSNQTEKRITSTTNINWIVDTAMSQMMQECGKNYLGRVGGKINLDEESLLDVTLAEMVAGERKRLAEEEEEDNKAKVDAEAAAGDGATPDDEGTAKKTKEEAGSKQKDESPSVESVTQGVAKLSTSDKPNTTKQQSPAIRIRILSVTPVKTSKRRGEIGGKVTLALYPPDPCLLFKENCREAGKLAAEMFITYKKKEDEEKRKKKLMEEEEKAKKKEEEEKVASEETTANGDSVKEEEDKQSNDKGGETAASDEKGELKEEETSPAKDVKADVTSKSSTPPAKVYEPRFPQIPYYPLLSPAERSRTVARSRVLLQRTIEAMKIHAAYESTSQSKNWRDTAGRREWEITESESQKTWKVRSHPMVASLLEGSSKELSDLVVEHDDAAANNKAGSGAKKGRKGGFFGDSRADRYDSTIENSEDYKAFMQSLQDGSNPSSAAGDKDAAKKSGDTKKEDEKPPAVDEEGRPISAIVQYFLDKQEEERKVKAEAAAAVAKARAAALAAKERIRKEKLKAKKEASKKRKKEAARLKKQQQGAKSGGGSSSSGRMGGGGSSKGSSNKGGVAMPPPGAMLLKKGGGVIPPSGFG